MDKGDLGHVDSETRRISWSIMDKWNRCKRMWYYRYVGQVDTKPTMPLLFGSLFHTIMESESHVNLLFQKDESIRNSEIKRREADIEGYVELRCLDIKPIVDQWKAESLEPFSNYTGAFPDVRYTEIDVFEHEELIYNMFGLWLRNHAVNDLRLYDVIAIEPVINELPIFNYSLGAPSDRFKMVGKVDLVLRDRANGSVFIREYKTTALDARKIDEKVSRDPQIRLYAHALERLGYSDGKTINRVQYAVIRKKTPSTPAKLKCKKCKEVGCNFCGMRGWTASKSKACDTTVEHFMKFLKNHHINPTDYIETLNNIAPSDKFVSLNTHFISEESKEEAVREMLCAITDIDNALHGYDEAPQVESFFPRNTGQCERFCSYKDACTNRQHASTLIDGDYYSKRVDHPELPELYEEIS